MPSEDRIRIRFVPGGPVRAPSTLLHHALASLIAWWTAGPRWRRALVRAVWPLLGRLLDDLVDRAGKHIGMPL